MIGWIVRRNCSEVVTGTEANFRFHRSQGALSRERPVYTPSIRPKTGRFNFVQEVPENYQFLHQNIGRNSFQDAAYEIANGNTTLSNYFRGPKSNEKVYWCEQGLCPADCVLLTL